jgi:predicted ThiF/HesA family dinucleotide-utilizing enzyme
MKIKTFLFLALLSSFLLSSAHARIGLNLSLIYKKGNDKGLVLFSELHSYVEVNEDEEVMLKMKNGTKAFVKVNFIRSEETFGPSSVIECNARFFNQKNIPLKKTDKVLINLGEEKTISHEDNEGQLIELKIVPDVL